MRFIPRLLAIVSAFALSALVPGLGAESSPDTAVETEQVDDPFGRNSPRAMQIGLFNVLGSGEVADLAPYIEGADPESDASLQRMRSFTLALDQSGELTSRLGLSIDPEGNLADGLAP